jgi:hypothetical protein
MTDHAERPLLFLDVDGTLLPFGQDPQRQPGDAAPDSHLALLSPRTGLRLAAMPCELVWASAWEDDTNAEIAPRIGLPRPLFTGAGAVAPCVVAAWWWPGPRRFEDR